MVTAWQFVREYPKTSFVVVGIAGMAVGAIATIVVHRLVVSLDRKLTNINLKLDQLHKEVAELKQELKIAKQSPAVYAAGTTKSGAVYSDDEDEEDFQEASEGISRSRNMKTRERLEIGPSSEYNPLLGSEDYTSLLKEGPENGDAVSTELYLIVDKLCEGTDEDKEKAYGLLAKASSKYSNQVDFLWRYAKASFCLSQLAKNSGDLDKEKELLYFSNDIAKQAISVTENNAHVHKWYAITLGKVGDYEGVQTRILNGYKFREHIQKAIAINPSDPNCHYLLGRWCYGVYMLTWMERKLAATLFATPPSSTVEEALQCFQKADQLMTKPWKENMLYIAKCYIETYNYQSAARWLSKANTLPSINSDDRITQSEVESLLRKYQSYL